MAIATAVAAYWMITAIPEFDGEKAFQHLEQQCEFGPRVPGSAAHQRCGDYLMAQLGTYADQVREQRFEYRDKRDTSQVYSGRNIVASFNMNPAKKYRIMLSAHWDTRPFADQDPDSNNHVRPVPGANDGASGVAVLLEMARLLEKKAPDFGVDIVLFDLEDLGEPGAALESDTLNPYCLGSQHFAANLGGYRPRYGILLDMIGDADLRIPIEGYSQNNAPHIVRKIWQAARKVGASAFVDDVSEPVVDDHVPFLQQGIPVIDLIDFDYPYWHTLADTPDKCSPTSLQQVGDVLVEILYRVEGGN